MVEVDGELSAAERPDRTEARNARVLAALTDEPQTVEELAERAGLSPKQVRGALSQLGPAMVRDGTGVRGDRRAPSGPGRASAGGGEARASRG